MFGLKKDNGGNRQGGRLRIVTLQLWTVQTQLSTAYLYASSQIMKRGFVGEAHVGIEIFLLSRIRIYMHLVGSPLVGSHANTVEHVGRNTK